MTIAAPTKQTSPRNRNRELMRASNMMTEYYPFAATEGARRRSVMGG
jgi:hypothetical protein